MSPETTDLDWITEQLPEVAAPDPALTDHARRALIAHVADAQPVQPRRRNRRRARLSRGERVYGRPIPLGLAAVAAAAGVFAVVDITSTPGHGGVGSADAATILAKASVGLTPAAGQVLVSMSTDSQGYTNEMALDDASPQDWVQTLISAGGQPSVNGQQDDMREFYDAETNTIYRDSDTSRAVAVGTGDVGFLSELNAPGAQTTVDHDAALGGQPATTITSTMPDGMVYELWVDASTGDQPIQFSETPASGPTVTTKWSYQMVTPSASTPSPALLTALHPTATVTTLDNAAYQAAVSKSAAPAPAGNT
jgi:hypothetical protein